MSVRSPSSTTVLITGAAGFLGSHLCDYFLKRDWHVIGIDNLLTGAATNLDHLASDTRFRFLRHDVTKPFVVDDPIDLVLHFACPRSEEHTSELQSRPHLVCRLLLEKKKKRFILPTKLLLNAPF